jgi:zinc D-Ala-D-Ala dipeptidase
MDFRYPLMTMADDIILIGDPRVFSVPVAECGEPFVDLRGVHRRIAVDGTRRQAAGLSPYYCFVRRGVATRLSRAADSLPDDLVFLVKDAYRPAARQQEFFTYTVNQYRALFPDLDEEALFLKASAFVAPLETAPHPTGAAVDLTLATADGMRLDMGSEMDADPEIQGNRTHFAWPDCTATQRHNRDLLSGVLLPAGLVNYPTEWWHWSYGDKYWGLLTGNPAAYSAVNEEVVRQSLAESDDP